MKIAADQNVLYAREIFGHLGTVETYPGRKLSPEHLRDAEILVCRSTRTIDAGLLEDTPVRFVGTATIGTDHLDKEYLRDRGIEFTNAAGSNANSVAEYVAEALLVMAKRAGRSLSGKRLGVVGCGNVGSRVVRKARALDMEVVQNDPPLARKTGDAAYRPLEEALQCDFVTMHVPLTREGRDATWHMVNRDFIGGMKQGAIFLNSSRGAVVDEVELVEALRSGELSAAVLDVWDGEPSINATLLRLAEIGTPHIAGYSLDGKAAGTQMIYEAVCEFLDLEPVVTVRDLLPAPDVPEAVVAPASGGTDDLVLRTCQRIWNILDDDAKLRESLNEEPPNRPEYFDSLRHSYGIRREFHNTELEFQNCPRDTREKLLGLGFRRKTRPEETQ